MGLFTPRLTTKRMAALTHELWVLHESGIPILRGLELAGARNRTLKPLLEQVADDIHEGATLTQAVRRQSKYFPPLFVELVAIGEQAGGLASVLSELSRHYEGQLALQRAYVRGLTYPAAVCFAAMYLIPLLKIALGRVVMGGEAASILGPIVMSMVASLAVTFAVVVGTVRALSFVGLLPWIVGVVGAYAWPVSSLMRKFAFSHFLRAMALMLDSGLSAVQSVERAAAASGNRILRRDLAKAVPAVQQGAPFVKAFKLSRLLPLMALEMINVGEQSGKMGEALRKAAEYLYTSAMHTLKVGATIIEAIAIIALAIMLFK